MNVKTEHQTKFCVCVFLIHPYSSCTHIRVCVWGFVNAFGYIMCCMYEDILRSNWKCIKIYKYNNGKIYIQIMQKNEYFFSKLFVIFVVIATRVSIVLWNEWGGDVAWIFSKNIKGSNEHLYTCQNNMIHIHTTYSMDNKRA